jgi:hypothetical protein
MEPCNTNESAVRSVIARIDAAWRLKQFDGLDECFDSDAVIVGPGYREFARGRHSCAESYREFATNAAVLAYSESGHNLQIWATTAIYTFSWEMSYQREAEPVNEAGTDQLVFQLCEDAWQLVWRYIFFQPPT